MISRREILACAACAAALVVPAQASAAVTAEFVKDLNPGVAPSDPGGFVNVSGIVFFAASDDANGTELWSTDGTIEGTNMIKDINPGTAGSDPSDLTSINGELYFSAGTADDGTELWKSDGTTAGTVLVKDLQPGTASSQPDDLIDMNGTLFFTGADETNGRELWSSDGTDAGTTMVKDINPNPAEGSSPQGLKAVGSTLYFAADDGSHGPELWSSDGTSGGTDLVDDINPGPEGSDPGELTLLNDKLFFAASDATSGRELWAEDTAGGAPYLVEDINPGANGSVPANSFPAGLTVLNNRVLFKADSGVNGGPGLWSSDGTAAGTSEVRGLTTMSQALKRVGGLVFFVGFDFVHGSELWRTDGTTAGTDVLDVTPGSSGTAITLSAGFATAQGHLFFAAGTDNELWSSDGTVAGTGEVANINPNGPSSPHNLVDIQGRLHFAADNGVNGSELWRTRIDLDPTIDSGPTGHTNSPRPTFTFSSDDPSATFTCSLDTGTASFGPCSGAQSHQPASDLADGGYVFRVRATDALGNYATAARAFTVDTVPPSVSVTGGPTGPTTDQRPVFTFTAEAGATMACSIDTGTPSFAPCSGATSHQPATELANGDYTFRVRATDSAGNGTVDTRTFSVIDIVPPSLSITGGPDGLTNDPRPSFSFDVEPTATVECSIDTGTASYGPCSSATGHQPASDLADASYTFRVRATDAAGNQTEGTRAFSVSGGGGSTDDPPDGPPPLDVKILSGPSGKTKDPTPTFEFSSDDKDARFLCWVNGGPKSPCNSPTTLKKLKPGDYKFSVVAINADGKPSDAADRSFKVKRKRKHRRHHHH